MKFGEIHLIPFDLGFYFYDKISDNNVGNKKLAEYFLDELNNKYHDCVIENRPIFREDLIEAKKLQNGLNTNDTLVKDSTKETQQKDDKYKKIIFGEHNNLDLPKTMLCRIKLTDRLYCYVSVIGIATFVLGDFNNEASSFYDKEINNCPLPVLMALQKKVAGCIILENEENKKELFKDYYNSPAFKKVFKEELEAIKSFKNWCWDIMRNNKVYSSRRQVTSCIDFRHEGFSYVMSILVSKDLNNDEINYLLAGQTPSFYSHSKDYINKSLEYYADSVEHNKNINQNHVHSGYFDFYFSWSSILVKPKNEVKFEDFIFGKHNELKSLLFSELDVQSKWFIVDNSIENTIDADYQNAEKMQKLISLMKIEYAEIENCANSTYSSIYLALQDRIVATSKIKELYQSVITKMNAQLEQRIRLDEKIRDQEMKSIEKKNQIILLGTDVFLAVFTGAGFAKTALDIIYKKYDTWTWVFLFTVIIVLILVTVIKFLCANKKPGKKAKKDSNNKFKDKK